MYRKTPLTAIFSLGLVLIAPSHMEAQAESGRLSIHVGGVLFQPDASGSVFELTASELAVGSSEYRHFRPSAEVAIRIHPRLSLMAGWSSGSKEIQSTVTQGMASQATELTMNNTFTGGAVLHLARWGADGAWQLDALGGLGRQSYAFRQVGIFPDASRPGNTFSGAFFTDGKADLQFAGLRLDRAISRRLGVSAGVRYQWSEGEATGDYQGFAPISLSGFGVSTGVRLTP